MSRPLPVNLLLHLPLALLWPPLTWRVQGEAFTPSEHVWTEREARLSRLTGAQSELERLTR